MKMRYPILISGGLCCSAWGFIYRPFPMPGNDPVLDLVLYHTPNFYGWIVPWYYAAPAVALIVGGLVLISVWRVWFETWGSNLTAFKLLPPWPLSPDKDAGPGIVVGEVHHPVKPVEIRKPSRLIIPERGLYTGVAIFGAVGSGKTSACMHPFAEQILSWQAGNPQRRAARLILEVKGDFCHDIRRILADAGREEDYIELGMEGSWQWNPLSTKWLDSYSLAYTISSLLNQLFGKGKEPFWQQAYTNLVRWIIELYRVFPGQWVTLRQVYHCAIDKELFAAKIKQAEAFVRELQHGTVVISFDDYLANADHISGWRWQPPTQENTCHADHSPSLESQLKELQIEYRIEWTESVRSSEIRQRVEAVNRWYQHDWQMIDNKIRSSIVEGISVILSIFDLPDVARVFCPPPPPKKAAAPQSGNGEPQEDEQPGLGTRVRQSLPPLDELIESGKVLALNMPAGSNPALARAVGVMLKNAWLQSLLRRPAYAPELLVAVWLYAYALGVTSSRRLEQRVREDLAFRYLAAGATPDFWTLNQFRRQHGRALNDLFTQVVELARAAGLGRLGHVAIDSTRVAANASPNRVETKERLRAERARIRRRIRRWQQACNADDPNEASGLELKKEEMTRLQERLAEIPSRLEQLKRARQRHISRTDPDSRFLRDRRGFTLGYTVDVAVSEDHLIVEQRVTQAATDNASLLPVVEAVERRCGEMPQKVSADSGFFSVKNLEALTASGIDAYVPDSNMAHALNRGGRVRHRTRHPEHRRMRQKLRSPTGRAVYRRRKALIEPVFGVLKEQRGMRRFRRRGLAKVAVEMLLAATAYNLTRLYHARPSFVTPPG